MKIGAHVSIAKGLDLSVDGAVDLGIECIQIHGQSPRTWKKSKFSEKEVKLFKQKVKEHHLFPIFLHGIHLVNLATSEKQLLLKSIDSLIHFMKLAKKIGANGVIFHIGSLQGQSSHARVSRVVRAIRKILQKSPKGPLLILEHSVQTGGGFGGFGDLKDIKNKVKSKRVRFCLDLCHLFASGHRLGGKGLGRTIEMIEKTMGLENVVVVHVNDSKGGFDSRIDRHENLGQGKIGKKGIQQFVNHPKLKHLPFIIETPGFNKKGADQKNIAILKSLQIENHSRNQLD